VLEQISKISTPLLPHHKSPDGDSSVRYPNAYTTYSVDGYAVPEAKIGLTPMYRSQVAVPSYNQFFYNLDLKSQYRNLHCVRLKPYLSSIHKTVEEHHRSLGHL